MAVGTKLSRGTGEGGGGALMLQKITPCWSSSSRNVGAGPPMAGSLPSVCYPPPLGKLLTEKSFRGGVNCPEGGGGGGF